MKRIFYLLLLSLFAFNLSAQNYRKFLKVGEEFMESGKYEDAIQQFTKAMEINPEKSDAYLLRAQSKEALSDYESAREDYERLSILDDEEESYYYHAARMSFALEDFGNALVATNKALIAKRIYPEAQQLKVMTLIKLEKYSEALEMAKEALRYKESDVNYYNYGVVNEKVELWEEALNAYSKAIRKNRNYYEAYAALADLQRQKTKLDEALETINTAIQKNKDFLPAYRVRSAIYADQLKYSAAINDISTILLMRPEDPEMYFLRGKYYQDYAQHLNAVSDFTKVLSIEPDNIDALFNRAYSYEQIMRFDEAIKDYRKLGKVAEDDEKAMELLAQAEERLYELNRESEKPGVKITNPAEIEGKVLNIPKDKNVVPIVGQASDKSGIEKILVNDMEIPFKKNEDGYFEFMTSVNVNDSGNLKVEVIDIYNNSLQNFYEIVRTEVNPPIVKILAPYASDNNVVYLESNNSRLYVEGAIQDESLIKSIFIDDVIASYIPDDMNPAFQATINIQNKNQFVVKAEDKYGNITETTFKLNRETASMLEENPMGRTWVVFIENSNYTSFASLEGPVRDVSLMKAALLNYSVHNFIHKKDLTKNEMQRFFSIELRDLLRSNRVNSLMVWYAGHGKFLNETGYWVPVDASRDDEFSYYDINALKAAMQSYPTTVNHTLVITDACESGPSFYQAMRSSMETRDCNDPTAVRLKSSQVFSSAGYELAVDNSQFTRTFANVLSNNRDACLPIESVVQKVTDAVVNANQQKPQFGKIAGLEDENGTFFFISK